LTSQSGRIPAVAPVLPSISHLPYRGRFGDPRPQALDGLILPPNPMPSHDGARPLKAWRYVGVFAPELMLCLGAVRIGRARQAFWAVWDRRSQRLRERTVLGRGRVKLAHGVARLLDPEVQIDLALEETAGIEAVCATGQSYAWTRKQGGVRARGTVVIDGQPRRLDARAVVDDTAAYYERHTRWRWSAGVGRGEDGSSLAWNLVAGVNDPPASSERTIWIDGEPTEPGPCRFADDLSGVDELSFSAEATRARRENLLLVRSSYRQPFGTFSGRVPGGPQLAEGYGVMEDHDVWW
jgi:Protein of unknown function (DUF2804)